MSGTFQARSDIITNIRQETSTILEALESLNGLRKDWDAGMSTWIIDASGDDPTDPNYEPHDFAGINEGLMKADISAVIGTTLDAINTLLASGHRTNMTKISM